MKKVMVALLIVVLIFVGGCSQNSNMQIISEKAQEVSDVDINTEHFEESDLGNPELLQYIKDNIYASLEKELKSDDFTIEQVEAIYISKEYLEELAYNSKSNIFFGYTLEEIESQFSDEKYIFTLGDDGNTVVKQFEPFDDTNEQLLKNIAIGSGVILVCVTVSVVTGGAGLPAVSMIFTASAKTGAVMAVSSGAIGGVASGIAMGVQTGDMNQALKAAEVAASENFKWGAITGVLAGGATKAITIKKSLDGTNGIINSNGKIPSSRESEERALKKYGGNGQVSYLNGKQVPPNILNATRPDIIRETKNGLEAIEVKNYNLADPNNRYSLYRELKRQVTERVKNLPPGTSQRVVLEVKGRGFSKDIIKLTKDEIQKRCADVYPNLPVSVMR